MDLILHMSDVHKKFGAHIALNGVDLQVERGEVHALVGENGAGKSTLMKVLSGALRADSGSMQLDGRPYQPSHPAEARHYGVAMIYQELNLAPHLSIEDNLHLGREPTRFGMLRRRAHRRRIRDALELLDHAELQPATLVRTLGPGARQVVEIARALTSEARVLVMDEPTSSLSATDTERLFGVVERLRSRGVSIIYISHFLDEVKRVAERYTVLRDGATVAAGRTRDCEASDLIEHMVGRRVEELFPRVPHEIGDVALSVDQVTARGLSRPVDLELRSGEILGIAGLVGAGRTELLRAIFGLAKLRGGLVRLLSSRSGRPTPAWSLRHGMGLLSEDRALEGLALDLSLEENVTLSHMQPFTRRGWVRLGHRRRLARDWLDRLNVRSSGPRQKARELSGGNQQKVAVARLLHHDVEVLLLDEPTRGVDVGSKVEIYRLIGRWASQGKAVVFVSSYIPELLGVCDSIRVMHRGSLSEARPVERWSEAEILDQATRGFEAAGVAEFRENQAK